MMPRGMTMIVTSKRIWPILYCIFKLIIYSANNQTIIQQLQIQIYVVVYSFLARIKPYYHNQQQFTRVIYEQNFKLMQLFLNIIPSCSHSMKIFKYISTLIQLCDFFKTAQLLRYKNQNQYRTLTGGFFSVAIIITIMAGFANMIIQTLNLTSITFTLNTINHVDPTLTNVVTSPDQNFMFAIQIGGLNLSAPIKYFDIMGIKDTAESGASNKTMIVLEQCTREHWSSLPSVVDRFDALGVSGWLCSPINAVYPMYGERASAASQFLNYYVLPCQNGTSPNQTCANQADFDAMVASTLNTFQLTLFYTKSIINPTQPDYINYALQDKKLLLFGTNIGLVAFFNINDFTINTDYSIWPFSDIQTFQGYSFEDGMSTNSFQITSGNPLLILVIAKSSDSLIYTRQVQKISSVFSFVGGLIGAVLALMFIVQAYTGFSYQIAISLEIFYGKDRKRDPQLEEKLDTSEINVNFFHFIKYHLFSIFNSKTKMVNWPMIDYIYSCRKEIMHHLDINSLVKRLIFLEHALSYLFDEHQLEGLKLNRPTTLSSIKKSRQRLLNNSNNTDDVEQESEKSQDASVISQVFRSYKRDMTFKANPPPEYAMHEFDDKMSIDEGFDKLGPNLSKLDSNIRMMKKKKVNREDDLAIQHKFSHEDKHHLQDQQESKQKEEEEMTDQQINAGYSNLNHLKQSALKGDMVSKRIWLQIHKNMEKERHQNEAFIPVQWVDK